MRGGVRKKMKIIDHTNGERYETIAEAAEGFYTSYSVLQKKLQGKDRIEFGGHDLEVVRLDVGATGKCLQCIETGKIYESYREATQDLGVSISTLSVKLRGKQEALIAGRTIRKVEGR